MSYLLHIALYVHTHTKNNKKQQQQQIKSQSAEQQQQLNPNQLGVVADGNEGRALATTKPQSAWGRAMLLI